MAAGWDEGGWGSHPAPPVAQGTVTSAPGATSQGSWVCLELSQHSHPTPAPECPQGTALEHSMITSWDLPGGQEVTSVLVWHPEARFTRREMHGFVSSSKGKHLPKSNWLLALSVWCPCSAPFHLLLAAPQNVFQENHPRLPRPGSLTHSKHTGWAHVGLLLLLSSAFPMAPAGACHGMGWWDGSWEGMEKLAGQINTLPCGGK